MPVNGRIEINDMAVNRLLRESSNSDLRRRGRKVGAAARSMAPGSMKRKIQVNLESGHVRVECTHPATMFVIRKTQPHAIRPNPPRTRLRFMIGNRVVFARKVWHPGNRKPNNFLGKALRAAR